MRLYLKDNLYRYEKVKRWFQLFILSISGVQPKRGQSHPKTYVDIIYIEREITTSDSKDLTS